MRVQHKSSQEYATAHEYPNGYKVIFDADKEAGFYFKYSKEELDKWFVQVPEDKLELPANKYTLKLDPDACVVGFKDNVNSPEHYTNGHVETIYAIENVLGPEGFKAYCMGNYMKYMARHRKKNGEEDLKKAEVYLGWAANGLPAPVNGKVPK